MVSKEMVRVYELVLNSPGMAEEFKLSVTVTRKQVLLICLLLEQGITPTKERAEELAALLSKETVGELAALVPEILKKGGAGLPEFYDRLKAL